MKKIKIVFMGTPEFAVPTLKLLNENCDVSLVITQPDRVNRRGNKVTFSPVKKFSLENEIEIYQPDNVNMVETVDKIKSHNPDYIVVVAYGQIIKKDILEIPKRNIVNVHASLLPKYRGAAPIHRAIMDREDKTGISIMKVGPGLDKGEVYLTKETEISDKKLPELHDELSSLGGELLLKYVLEDFEKEIKGIPQNDSLATYAEKVNREDGYLDFKNIDKEIGKINGLYPRPGASINYFGERVKVLDGEVFSYENNPSKEISEILNVDKRGIFVNCNDGIILIKEIQFPGKKPMTVEDYLKGNSINITRLR